MSTYAVQSANDRLKQNFERTLAVSFVFAAVFHVLVFELWPEMRADGWTNPQAAIVDVVRLDQIEIPPEPAQIVRPSAPVATPDVSVEQTIPKIGFDEYIELPPPSDGPGTGGEASEAIPFTPYTLAPTLANEREVQRALERAYPPALRDVGLGGTVSLMLHIDATGRVLEARLGETSGYEALDQAALGLADILRFRPAMNRDKRVAVWIQIPLAFRTR